VEADAGDHALAGAVREHLAAIEVADERVVGDGQRLLLGPRYLKARARYSAGAVPAPKPPSRSDPTAALHVRAPPPLGALVRVSGATAFPAERALGEEPCVIGAGKGADVIISDPAVSRAHVELSLVPEGVAVRDLGSRNGTFYLGQRVEKIILTLGSRLRVGAAELAIEPDLASLAAGGDEAPLPAYRGLTGASPAMRRLFAALARLEGSLVNVLVEGESGVGKELVARALHEGSRVAAGPLVVVNCGALGRELSQSELFGHRKGAFTGAHEARRGAFEAAHGGTLFLDEIGELPLDVQPVLLRALESGEVKPLGENEPRRVKVRLVAATHRDLLAEARAGRFREDLFYRLAVVRLGVPPLRDRPEDIALLAREFAAEAGLGELPAEAVAFFQAHPFPGNARELRNAVQAYVALGALPEARTAPEGEALTAALRALIDPSGSYQEQKELFVNRFARVYLELLLARTGGNQSEAARVSGVERSYLGKLLAKHGVK
jgi:DNA-binding NtrC family response regulator